MEDKFINEENDGGVITLTTAQGDEVDFVEVAGIALGEKFYAILQPVELLEGMEDDEALVFEVGKGEDGGDKYSLVLDDGIIDAVFEEYNRILDDLE